MATISVMIGALYHGHLNAGCLFMCDVSLKKTGKVACGLSVARHDSGGMLQFQLHTAHTFFIK